VFYNWGKEGSTLGCRLNDGANLHALGNYAQTGQDTNLLAGTQHWITIQNGGNARFWVDGNLGPFRLVDTQDDIDIVGNLQSLSSSTAVFTSYNDMVINPASAASGIVINTVGDRPGVLRNTLDRLAVSSIINKTGSIIDRPAAYPTQGDYPTVSAAFVAVANPFGIASNGYTNIENQINALADSLT